MTTTNTVDFDTDCSSCGTRLTGERPAHLAIFCEDCHAKRRQAFTGGRR